MPSAWLADSLWLLEELLDDELLLELLLLAVDELLLGGLPLLLGGGAGGGVGGGVELGVEGVCGVVGLLALGQPLSSRQAQASPASLRSNP